MVVRIATLLRDSFFYTSAFLFVFACGQEKEEYKLQKKENKGATYMLPLVDLSEVDPQKCKSDRVSDVDLANYIVYADLNCIKRVVQQNEVNLDHILPRQAAFGGVLPLELSLSDTALYYAPKKGQALVPALLISLGASVNAPFTEQRNVLDRLFEISEKYPEVVHYLLEQKKLDLDKKLANKKLPVQEATEMRLQSVLAHMIDLGVDLNAGEPAEKPVILAIQKGFEEIIELLVLSGVELNTPAGSYYDPLALSMGTLPSKVSLFIASKKKSFDWIDGSGKSYLHLAVEHSQPSLLQFLVEKKLDVNHEDHYGETSVFSATRNSDLGSLQVLKKFGADLNQKNLDQNTIASEAKDVETLEFLVAHGVLINERNVQGETPMLRFIREGSANLAQFLYSHGVPLDWKSERTRRNLLHEAVASRRIESIRFLLDQGFNPDLADNEGVTPIFSLYGENKSVLAILDLLAGAGADLDWENPYGRTPLHSWIVSRMNQTVSRRFFDHGAEVHWGRSNKTSYLIELIRSYGDPKSEDLFLEMVELLLDEGVDLSRVDQINGDSAATLLYSNQQVADSDLLIRLIDLFILKGKNLNTPNKKGQRLGFLLSTKRESLHAEYVTRKSAAEENGDFDLVESLQEQYQPQLDRLQEAVQKIRG